MNIAEYIIEYIYNLGVKDIFTVSGGGSIYLCDALRSNKNIRYICCHHEQGVVFASEGYARSRNTMGVSVVTSGPGGTNVLTGLNAAYVDSVPILVLTGQVFSNQMMNKHGVRQFGLQESNIVELAGSVTKYAKTILPNDDIHELLGFAIKKMNSGRKGPVLLDIPVDVQKAEYSAKTFSNNKESVRSDVKISNKIIEDIFLKISNAKKPLLLLGHGVVQSFNKVEILAFLDDINIPIVTSWNATELGYLNNFVGRPGMFNQRYANIITNQTDLLIVLGCRLHIGLTGYDIKSFAKNAKVIWVDIDKNELDKYEDKRFLKINTDLYHFVELLKRKGKINSNKIWLDKAKKLKREISISNDKKFNSDKVDSFYFISKLSNALNKNDVVVTDMGLSFVGTHQYIDVKKGNKVFTNAGHAPMGWGLPAAIGAATKICDEGARVFCITGEGGLMMNIQELATLSYHKLNVIIFIFNNGGYQTIKQTQQLSFKGNLMGSTAESGLFFPDFRQLALSFNINYSLINDKDNLHSIELGIVSGPIIFELMLDEEQEHGCKLITKRDGRGDFIYSDYDDVYPFIDEHKLKAYRSELNLI